MKNVIEIKATLEDVEKYARLHREFLAEYFRLQTDFNKITKEHWNADGRFCDYLTETKGIELKENTEIVIVYKNLDLSKLDLSQADFKFKAIFENVNFSNCNLTNADVRGGVFINCKFDGANCQNIDLRNTSLKKTSFKDADLSGGNLKDIKVDETVSFENTIFNRAIVFSTRIDHFKDTMDLGSEQLDYGLEKVELFDNKTFTLKHLKEAKNLHEVEGISADLKEQYKKWLQKLKKGGNKSSFKYSEEKSIKKIEGKGEVLKAQKRDRGEEKDFTIN